MIDLMQLDKHLPLFLHRDYRAPRPHTERFVFFSSIKSNSRNSNELSSATRYSRTSVIIFCVLFAGGSMASQ